MTLDVLNGGGAGGIGVGGSSAASAGGFEVYSTRKEQLVATRDSDTVVLLSGMLVEPDRFSSFKTVISFDSAGNKLGEYNPIDNVFSWNSTTKKLTVTGASFQSGGTIEVEYYGPPLTVDQTNNLQQVQEQDPLNLTGDDAGVPLIVAAQDFTAAWVDLGAEISMFGKNRLGLYVTLDKNDSLDMRLRCLAKHEQGGTEEYPAQIETIGTSDIKIEPAYWEFNNDVDQLAWLVFKTDGVVPYVQTQIAAGTPGTTAGRVTAAYYVRAWSA